MPQRFQQRDVSLWGIVALASVGFAIVLANIGPSLPRGIITGLHSSRLEGGSVVALSAHVRDLERELADLRRINRETITVLTLSERSQGEITKRVGALEASIPNMLEAIPADKIMDRSAVTASINGPAASNTKPAQGGTVSYTLTPLFAQAPQAKPLALSPEDTPQDVPPPLSVATIDSERVDTETYGVAVGEPLGLGEMHTHWLDFKQRNATLLIGLIPILTHDGADRYRLVVGPIASASQAENLCNHIERSGTACFATDYSGYAMPK